MSTQRMTFDWYPFQHAAGSGLLTIEKGTLCCCYTVRQLKTDFGTGFRLEKHGDPVEDGGGLVYDVLLDGERATCECLGHLRYGTECKHIWAMRQVMERGFDVRQWPSSLPMSASKPADTPF